MPNPFTSLIRRLLGIKSKPDQNPEPPPLPQGKPGKPGHPGKPGAYRVPPRPGEEMEQPYPPDYRPGEE